MYPRIEAFGQSDAGCVREVNEDNFLCLDLSTAPAGSEPAAFLLAAEKVKQELLLLKDYQTKFMMCLEKTMLITEF